MDILRHRGEVPSRLRGGIIAIGNFDGVHRGHGSILAAARRRARAEARPFGILTFEPHPRSVFRPDLVPFRLTPLRIKLELLATFAADFVLVQAFDRLYAATSAESFAAETLGKALAASHVVIGRDYAFGRDREGDSQTLARLGETWGFAVTELPPVSAPDGSVYSSTAAREALRAGDCARAAAILGRPWAVEGRVEHGQRRGRTIGFPTANVRLGDTLHPRPGVYAVRARTGDGPSLPGIANFGKRPTFDGTGTVLEVHLFDTAENLYDRHLHVEFEAFLRDERKFDGIEALRRQIESDAQTARRRLSRPAASDGSVQR